MSQIATSHSRSLKLSTNGLKPLPLLTSHSLRLILFIVGSKPLLLVTPLIVPWQVQLNLLFGHSDVDDDDNRYKLVKICT
jgi:hypothetical protein